MKNKIIKNHIKNIALGSVAQFVKSDFFTKISDTEANDIFIVGYPKSGNTWMQSLIAGIIYGIDTTYLPFSLANDLVPDLHARKFYKRYTDIIFFKSHNLPQKQYRKVIYLVRDGRDVIVSYYHMKKNQGLNPSFSNMITKGEGLFPSKWHVHVNAWLTNPFKSDILFIKYEDLLINTFNELKKICEFSNIIRSDQIILNAIKGNTFEMMKSKAKIFDKMGNLNLETTTPNHFFRKGITGNFEDEFPPELLEIFLNDSRGLLKHFNYI